MRLKPLVQFFSSFSDEMQKRNITGYAGSIAFFLVLSSIPLLVLFSLFIPAMGINQNDFTVFFTSIVPASSISFIAALISEAYNMSGAIFPVSLVILLFTCSRAMMELMRGLQAVYDVKIKRGYLYLRALACVYTLLLIVLLALMIILLGFGDDIMHLIRQHWIGPAILFQTIYQFRYIIVFVSGILILSLTYKLASMENQPLIEQVPGAVCTLLAWVIFTKIFTFFTKISTYSIYYGSLSVLVIFLFWLYWCIYILLIGGYINWYFRYVFRVWLLRLHKLVHHK